MEDVLTLERAALLDAADPLSRFRARFHIPQHAGKDCIYLCGNSLGLQPVGAAEAIAVELEDWARLGVEGHFHARNPWLPYHERFAEGLAHLTGAKESEVVAANNLTVNLHLLLATFYNPTGTRRKILMEAKAFPSDRYGLASQIRFHGGDPARDLIEVAPREGEHFLRTEDLEAAIADAGDTLATVLIGGVHYFTGVRHNLRRIAAAAHAVGATCGFDLAHAIGNVPLSLHADDVDFACWCSYKYLNSGPGAVAGYYIHERFHGRTDLPRFEGWWGHDTSRRFLMEPDFVPMPDAGAWQLSNAPVLNMAVHKVSLDLFLEAGMPALRARSLRLTAELEALLHRVSAASGVAITLFTPTDPEARGCQISFAIPGGRAMFDRLTASGVVADWREPDAIRMAPVPLYTSFTDLARLETALNAALTTP